MERPGKIAHTSVRGFTIEFVVQDVGSSGVAPMTIMRTKRHETHAARLWMDSAVVPMWELV